MQNAAGAPQQQPAPPDQLGNVRNSDYPSPNLPVLRPVPFPPAEDYAPCRRTRNARVYNPEGNGSMESFTVIARKGGNGGNDRAYALGKPLQKAIYGGVRHALGLRRRGPRGVGVGVEWEIVPGEEYAIKWMRWAMILGRRNQHPSYRMAEDPESEVRAMRFLEGVHVDRERRRRLQERGQGGGDDGEGGGDDEMEVDAPAAAAGGMAASLESHVLMLEEVLLDRSYLYSVMPFCSGGDMFDAVSSAGSRFTEGEARYWMDQMIQGLETLQAAGLSHRDISLENLMVHDGRCLVIDMGMCVRIPVDPGWNRRCLIEPQGPCGKRHYMSPEIYRDDVPFDGFAVDLWAVGVVLFLMLTKDFPWDLPVESDRNFWTISTGGLANVLVQRGVLLSDDVVDLLQNMMLRDPEVRLSLEQVKQHRWMMNGPKIPPAKDD